MFTTIGSKIFANLSNKPKDCFKMLSERPAGSGWTLSGARKHDTIYGLMIDYKLLLMYLL